MKKLLVVVIMVSAFFGLYPASGQSLSLLSPDRKICVNIDIGDQISCSVDYQDRTMISEALISLILNDGRFLGQDSGPAKKSLKTVDEIITPLLPTKSALVRDHYNEILLSFKDNYAIRFRAYNDGVAYRFESRFGAEVTIQHENLDLAFGDDFTTYFPEEESLVSHYERICKVTPVSMIEEGSFCSPASPVSDRQGIMDADHRGGPL